MMPEIRFVSPDQNEENSVYCPNCFIVMPMDTKYVDCPWCGDKVEPKPLSTSHACKGVKDGGEKPYMAITYTHPIFF